MIEEEFTDYHIIYGKWDDVENNQFLVFYHPNGIHCEVFIMGGLDYGGGVSYWFNCDSETLDRIVNQKEKYSGDIKREVEQLPEAKAKRKLSGFNY